MPAARRRKIKNDPAGGRRAAGGGGKIFWRRRLLEAAAGEILKARRRRRRLFDFQLSCRYGHDVYVTRLLVVGTWKLYTVSTSKLCKMLLNVM